MASRCTRNEERRRRSHDDDDEDKSSLNKDLKRDARLAVARSWDRHGSPVPRWT
jgi:hypothetical protein